MVKGFNFNIWSYLPPTDKLSRLTHDKQWIELENDVRNYSDDDEYSRIEIAVSGLSDRYVSGDVFNWIEIGKSLK